MSLLSENVIPGNQGKVFDSNAKEPQTLEKIKSALELIDGIKDVILHLDVYPRELTIHSSKMVTVKEIEDAVVVANTNLNDKVHGSGDIEYKGTPQVKKIFTYLERKMLISMLTTFNPCSSSYQQ